MKTPSQKELAAFAKVSLELGVVDIAAVTAWADKLLQTDDHPADWVIDLSMEDDTQRAIDLLSAVPGMYDLDLVRNLLFAQICRSQKGRELSHRETANELWRFSSAVDLLEYETRLELEIPYVQYEQFDAVQFQLEDQARVREALANAHEALEQFVAKYEPFESIIMEHFG